MKRSISLILSIALVFCFCMVPVSADDYPTATVTASLVGDVPAEGEQFAVAITVSDVSTGLFKNGGIEFSWATDVASLCRANGTLSTQSADAVANSISGYAAVTGSPISYDNKYDEDEGTGQFTTTAGYDLASGIGYCDIYIHQDAPDQSLIEVGEDGFVMYTINFKLNEGQVYDDFYFTITRSDCFFDATSLEASSTVNGAITTVSIKSSGALKEVTVDDVTYDVVSDNAVPYGGFEDENGDFTMGTWQSPSGSGYFDDISSSYFYAVDKATDEAELYDVSVGVTLESDDYALGSRWNDGATGLCSLANFIPVEAGKTYYVTFEYKHQTSGDFGYSVTSFTTTNEDFADGTKLGTPADATTEWQTAEFIFTAESDGYVYFHFRWLGDGSNTGSGPYWYYDNFGVYEVEAQETEEPSEEETEASTETEEPSDEETEEPSEEETEAEEPTEAEIEEPTIEGAYYGVEGQPGVDADDNGIYDLPQEITGKATVTFKGAVLVDANNTLIGINNSENMTYDAYFSGSSVMLLVNADGALSYRNGSSTVASGVNLTIGEEYDFTYEIDVENATWGVTIADADGNVVFTISDLAFRTTTDVLDCVVLANNSGYGKTVYVRDIVVTVEETEEPSDQEPSDEEPSDEEPSDEEPSDEETDEEPTEETTIPEDAFVSETGQVEDAIHEIDAVTTTGTVSFTFVADSTQANDTLVAVTNADAVLSNTNNYFANAGAQFMISGTTLSARIDGATTEIAQIVSGEAYDVVVTVDVEAQTWSAVVVDSEGNEVAEVPETAFRCESALESINAIVVLDNKGGSESAYVYNVAVEADSEAEEADLTYVISSYDEDYTGSTPFVQATFKLADGETAPTDVIGIISFADESGNPLSIYVGGYYNGETIVVGLSGSLPEGAASVYGVSLLTGTTLEDLKVVTAHSDLGTPVGVYYPGE